MEQNIGSYVTSCLSSFDTLSSELSKRSLKYGRDMGLFKIDDERGPLRIWSGNIGAHCTGANSLTYRLRDASHLQRRVVEFLEDLNEKLRTASAIVSGQKIPWDDYSDVSSDDGSTFGEETTTSLETETGPEAKTELQQLMLAITEIISCLMRLSLTIENPAPHDLFTALTIFDFSPFEKADIAQVKMKFPLAAPSLAERLGKAIARRRQYLKYRQEHHKKPQDDDVQQFGKIPESLTGDWDMDSYSNPSTSIDAKMNNRQELKIPSFPIGVKFNRSFLCPLCFMEISISNSGEWIHLQQIHPEILAGAQLSNIFDDCKTKLDLRTHSICDLCKKTQPSLIELRQHLGAHQEELALFALSSPQSLDVKQTEVPSSSGSQINNTEKEKMARFRSLLGDKWRSSQEKSNMTRESKRIDQMLVKSEIERNKSVKMLLLGAGESGKTTMLKQLRVQYGSGIDHTERENWRAIIRDNIIDISRTVLVVMKEEGFRLKNKANMIYFHWFQEDFSKDMEETDTLIELLRGIKILWNDQGLQKAVQKGHIYTLHDNTTYFLDNIDRIFAKDYLPTDEDILNARFRTTGITESLFHLAKRNCSIFDVGGQRSERRNWIHCFEQMNMLIFFVSMSGINACLVEDKDGNQMQEALMLWQSVVNSKWFEKSTILLVLNKMDAFVQQISSEKVSMRDYFPEYSGENRNVEDAKEFIEKFKGMSKRPKEVHVQCTSLIHKEQASITIEYMEQLVVDGQSYLLFGKEWPKLEVVKGGERNSEDKPSG
ncbi:hypothetical protein B7494_g4087 [Chlorociboria aeruginascens]|nr:hypothetical protein B7494_g4087 [Chlorociboria aeruginascens]